MNKDEALKLALEAFRQIDEAMPFPVAKLAQKAIREALADHIGDVNKMVEQPEQNQFNPDWDAMAVMVEEQQRMAKRIAELEAHRKPLTDEEIGRVAGDSLDAWSCARAIEAAHGIKGEA